MIAEVHPSSVVSPAARLGEDVVVGPFCVVEGDAVLGERTVLRSHVVVGPGTEIGEDNEVYPQATLGLAPQDKKYRGSPTVLRIGARNVIREGCTLHRGTEGGGGVTTIGDDNLFMAGAHVAHDCRVGSRNVFANNATLAGHVEVGDDCTLGAFSAVHQFCRVGDHAFTGGFTIATMDVLPFMRTSGSRDTRSFGPNGVGLQRKGFSPAVVTSLRKAHRILFRSGFGIEEALARTEAEHGDVPAVADLVRFIRQAQRGVHRG